MKTLPLLIALFVAAPLLAEDAPETPAPQNLISVQNEEKHPEMHKALHHLKEAKTKLYRAALDKLGVERTALLVENGKTLGQGLMLGARNLKGVELVLNNEVHPYDLLRYDRAIFSKSAIEQLTDSLVKSVSKRQLAAQTEAA